MAVYLFIIGFFLLLLLNFFQILFNLSSALTSISPSLSHESSAPFTYSVFCVSLCQRNHSVDIFSGSMFSFQKLLIHPYFIDANCPSTSVNGTSSADPGLYLPPHMLGSVVMTGQDHIVRKVGEKVSCFPEVVCLTRLQILFTYSKMKLYAISASSVER